MDTHWLGDLGFLASDLEGLQLNENGENDNSGDSSFDQGMTSVTVGPSSLPAVLPKPVLDAGAIAPPTPNDNSFVVEPAATSTPARAGLDDAAAALGALDANSPLEKHRPAFCVFVASLAASLDDDVLYSHVTDHFAEYGHILSVKVLRDPQNRPYAFVQYGTQHEFDLALDKAHRSTLDDRQIRCEPARVNRTVLICSDFIEHPVTFSGITLMCAPYGQVEKLTPFDGTIGNGMFVRFAYREDAARAFVGLQAESWLRIYWVQNVADGGSGCYDPKQAFVGQLQPDVTEAELRAKFEAYGEIVGIEITARATFATAFVAYKSAMSTAQAVERLNHTMWMGRTIHVQNRQDKAKVRPQLAPPPSHIHGMMGADWSQAEVPGGGRDFGRGPTPRSWDWHKKKAPQRQQRQSERQSQGWQARPRVQVHGELPSDRQERSPKQQGQERPRYQGKSFQSAHSSHQKRGHRQKSVEAQFVPMYYYPVGYYGYNDK